MDTITYPEYIVTTLTKTASLEPGSVQRVVDSTLWGLSKYLDAPRVYIVEDSGQVTLVRKTSAEWFELTMELVMHRLPMPTKA